MTLLKQSHLLHPEPKLTEPIVRKLRQVTIGVFFAFLGLFRFSPIPSLIIEVCLVLAFNSVVYFLGCVACKTQEATSRKWCSHGYYPLNCPVSLTFAKPSSVLPMGQKINHSLINSIFTISNCCFFLQFSLQLSYLSLVGNMSMSVCY